MKPKQLTWRDGLAKTPFGEYEVHGKGRRWWLKFRNYYPNIANYRTKGIAQAAAQADFERRVKQCFEAKA